MSWSEAPSGSKWTQKLHDGQTATGAVRTVNVNMGSLNVSTWDVNKAGNIVEALAPLLDKSIYKSVRSVDYTLDEGE